MKGSRGIADCAGSLIVAAMVAGHVELALFEQTFANPDGMHQPFLFDVRVDGDVEVQRMAAIRYSATGTAIIVMEKCGELRCAPGEWRHALSG
ncbi:hypothetical protein MesoLj131a_57940 [Mesorhizobium sp. 131-2-1]|nr:hypothetical protein MesoLj131a_57940 [Mesorhizobium sp. 131-2-1]